MDVVYNNFHLSDWMHSIQSRFYFSNIIAAVFFTIFALFYWNIILFSERIDNQIDTVSQLSDQIDYTVTSLNANLNGIFYYHNADSNLRDAYRYFSEIDGGLVGSDMHIRDDLQKTLDMLVYLNTHISAAVYVNNQESVYIYSSGFYEQPEILKNCIRSHVASIRKHYGSPVEIMVNRERRKLLPIVKRITDLNTGKGIGYLAVYVDINMFFPELDAKTGVSSGYNTAIFSAANGELIYTTNISPNYFSDSGDFQSVYDLYQYVTDHMDSSRGCSAYHSGIILSSEKNNSSEWQIIKFSKDLSNKSSLSVSVLHYLYLCVLFLTFLMIFSFFISKAITKDLREFCRLIKKVDLHKMNEIHLEHRTYIELEDLIKGYNRMIQKLNEGIQKEYLYDLRQKEMQIKVLNYQINPHFLYNALNLISSLAVLHHIPTVSQISVAMSDMFRYSISNRQFVTIEDELNNLKRYILIQDLRFPGKFDVMYDVEDGVLSNFCVKFLMQPLAENCFKHAFHFNGDHKGIFLIEVRIRRDQNIVRISITDNGCGIDEECLQKLNDRLQSAENYVQAADCCIGLWNVSKRIAAYYGSQYGILVSSKKGFYTTVALTIPYIE